ncbi:TetR/AcrR family transcriptional regulator [Desulfosporosinus meridiei]|uniref:Transcriptional regulator n=1 Tax=Desulfosporosinus meridiei (strain ATCC BAA-275 / DSM 13257 / KCTC 12902 / NCIMB 13706 / S10) TaxID=768704 RepID=J7IU55_DESMD|nr:TetR/AcrR family transcriptional regulator [Desulfosporosinus meridiei]AFQ45372.1 transcriptional regulator [Desulfosporosinus meridiei DSM 13257]
MEPRDVLVEGRIERKKKETRQKIIRAAMDLIQRQGFDNTTMEQIAEEADVARKTLYNHFPVKEAIVDEHVRSLSREFTQETINKLQDLPDTRSRLLETLDKVYEQVEINPEIIGISMGYRLKNMFQGEGYSSGGTQSLITEIIRLGQLAGEIRQDIQAKLLVKQLDMLRGAVVMDWLNDPTRLELRKEMSLMVDLFLNGAIGKGAKK